MKRVVLLIAALLTLTVGGNLSYAQAPWPQFVFEHWVWEDESTQHSALQLVDDYKAHNIPVGAIIIDSPWETGYNTFEWDTTLFPNAQAMIDSFHARGVKVIVWTTSAINTDMTELWHYGDSLGYFMKTNAGSGSAVIPWWKGDGSMIDFFNPAAVTWWKSLMDKTLDMGIDGWKCDGTDYSIFLANATYSPGTGGNVTRLQYSAAYYRLFHDYTRQRLGNDRANMSRPVDNYGYTFITDPSLVSFTPRDIGFACWVGDQDATYDGMQKALNNMYQSDANNYLAFGSDIGGYRDEPVTNGRDKDLFIRWTQLGAFSPLMENGGGGEHRPWMFDQETDNIYRKFASLHQAMVPYQLHQADSLYALTQSLMQFQNSSEYSFALGSDIFVAPVLGAGGTVSIGSFPGSADTWVYLFNNSQTYQSGSSTIVSVPLGEYPVFVKSTSPMLHVLDSVVNSITAVNDINTEKQQVGVYPNPANGNIYVANLDFNLAARYNLRLTNALGQTVLTNELTITQTHVALPASLPGGMYYYNITSPSYPEMGVKGNLLIQK